MQAVLVWVAGGKQGHTVKTGGDILLVFGMRKRRVRGEKGEQGEEREEVWQSCSTKSRVLV